METFVLILLGLAGVLLHIVFKFQDAVTKEPKNGLSFKERFKLVNSKFDWLGSFTYSIIALIIVVVFVLIRDKIEALLPVTEITIIFIGYAADSVFKNLKPEKISTN